MSWVAIVLYRLLQLRARSEPSFVIGGKDNPYMRRWYVIPRNRYFNIYLHQILRDDDDRALHDHPWGSVSLMLHGQLGEFYKNGNVTSARTFRVGSLVFRGADFAHRLFLPGGGEAWTLFVTGPVVRAWGFHCPQGWRHHKEFSSPLDNGAIGRGCE